jgi:hypothetical protein
MKYQIGITFVESVEVWKNGSMEVPCISFKVHFQTSSLPVFHTNKVRKLCLKIM